MLLNELDNTRYLLEPVVRVQSVSKTFKTVDDHDLKVLDELSFELYENEIVALLGRSGSGKSTLLRIIAGLIKPTSGKVIYMQQEVLKPALGMSMVFQNFALLPWLTVLENVELGLEALGIDKKLRRERALKAIDVIGLDGFESAFPRELSGGMKQRVGFARALVVNPVVLLMDEPFASLDVLTADNLKKDMLDLLVRNNVRTTSKSETNGLNEQKFNDSVSFMDDKRNFNYQDSINNAPDNNIKFNTKSILFVTHNMQEAVMLADRIIIMQSNPGRIATQISVDIKHPRDEDSKVFKSIVDEIYAFMTQGKIIRHQEKKRAEYLHKDGVVGIAYRLPNADISELIGLIEMVENNSNNIRVDLPELAEVMHLDADELFPLTEILEILELAYIKDGDLFLTDDGLNFAKASIDDRKRIFANKLTKNVSLAKYILEVLNTNPDHEESKDVFIEEIGKELSAEEADRVMRILIDWGRYAEIFSYDNNTEILSLPT